MLLTIQTRESDLQRGSTYLRTIEGQHSGFDDQGIESKSTLIFAREVGILRLRGSQIEGEC